MPSLAASFCSCRRSCRRRCLSSVGAGFRYSAGSTAASSPATRLSGGTWLHLVSQAVDLTGRESSLVKANNSLALDKEWLNKELDDCRSAARERELQLTKAIDGLHLKARLPVVIAGGCHRVCSFRRHAAGERIGLVCRGRGTQGERAVLGGCYDDRPPACRAECRESDEVGAREGRCRQCALPLQGVSPLECRCICAVLKEAARVHDEWSVSVSQRESAIEARLCELQVRASRRPATATQDATPPCRSLLWPK